MVACFDPQGKGAVVVGGVLEQVGLGQPLLALRSRWMPASPAPYKQAKKSRWVRRKLVSAETAIPSPRLGQGMELVLAQSRLQAERGAVWIIINCCLAGKAHLWVGF